MSFKKISIKRLAIISTHPIQYYAPVFKLLHERQHLHIKVYYTWGADCLEKFDHGFGKTIQWDIPILEGYPHEWARNTSSDAGSHHFLGIINPDLIQQIESWQPDAVLIYGWAYHSHLKIMRHFKNKLPVYFRGDSHLLNESSNLKKQLRNIYLKWVYKYIDHAFYVGQHNKVYFKHYGLEESQLSFAQHAVDNDRFSEPKHYKTSSLRSAANIDEQQILILYAGKFESIKGVSQLLNAFIALNQPNAQLLLVGSGSNEMSLKLTAQHSPLSAQIHFLEFQNQSAMPAVYQACDLFCLPSVSETWGLAVNEAMACAKAVLVSDQVGCAIDLVQEGVNGAIFRATSGTSLQEKLTTLLKLGRAGLAEMGLHSKQIIADWSFQKQVSAIENAIHKK